MIQNNNQNKIQMNKIVNNKMMMNSMKINKNQILLQLKPIIKTSTLFVRSVSMIKKSTKILVKRMIYKNRRIK